MTAAVRASLGALAVLALIASGCGDSKQTDTNGTVTNPQKDQDPTPDTGTGGDQQGTVPAQPAQPAQ